MASYDSATFTVTEIFSTTLSATNLSLLRLHGFMLACIHLHKTGVGEMPERNKLEGCLWKMWDTHAQFGLIKVPDCIGLVQLHTVQKISRKLGRS